MSGPDVILRAREHTSTFIRRMKWMQVIPRGTAARNATRVAIRRYMCSHQERAQEPQLLAPAFRGMASVAVFVAAIGVAALMLQRISAGGWLAEQLMVHYSESGELLMRA